MTMYATLEEAIDAAREEFLADNPGVEEENADVQQLNIQKYVLQDGDILESRYAVTRRDRTIHARMREYLYELKHNPLLVTSVLPVGDGVAVSVKVSPDGDGAGKRPDQEENGK